MKKFFAIILGAIGLNALFSSKAESSFNPEINTGKKDEITSITLSDLLPSNLDPRKAANKILDFIGLYESNGNYNVSFGNGKYGSVNLTNMTLDQVREWQEKLIKNQLNQGIQFKNTSSAVGKYQFIRSTFDETRNKLKLSGNTKFSPSIQDEFAYYQLKQAGWADFIGGQITVEEMMLKISKIWASFPKNFTGISYYSKVANNKALVSPEKVATVLQEARKA